MDVKVVLGGLQDAIRRASEPEAAAAQASAYRKALVQLRRDERLRHVDGLDDLVRDFCVSCALDKAFDYVPDFTTQLEQHASEVRTRVMLHPVVGLTVTEPVVLGEVELVLIEEWPARPGVPALDPRVGALAKVSVRGSDARAMAARARTTVEDALAKLRLTAAGEGAINGQLLFHLDGFWVGDDGSHGWWMPPETVLKLGVTPALLEPTRAHPVVGLPRPAANKAQQQADFALKWLDHAMRSHDPLLRTVLPVFALEALLGDRSAGLKAKHLVFYRLMLSQWAFRDACCYKWLLVGTVFMALCLT